MTKVELVAERQTRLPTMTAERIKLTAGELIPAGYYFVIDDATLIALRADATDPKPWFVAPRDLQAGERFEVDIAAS